MPTKTYSPSKTSAVTQLKDLLSQAKSVAVVDYSGMKVSHATELRKAIKAAGGQMLVAKNTLFKVASDKTDLSLEGLSAFIFALTNEITPLKALADFIKKNSLLSFKLGFIGAKQLTASEIAALANTPSRDTSISKLLYLLNFNTSKLAVTLNAIAKSGKQVPVTSPS